MELHQLRYLVAVVEAGSFSRAAGRCFVSQPSLSQQIAKLERTVGQQLLVRLGRRVVPTDAGRLLVDRAAAILAAVDDAARRLSDEAGQPGGRLAIGAIPTVAPYLLPPVLGRFMKECPDVELALREDVTRELLPAVAAGDLDMAIVALPVADERLLTAPLLTEQLLLVTPRRHRLARKPRITLDDLRQEPFILLNEEHCLGEEVLTFCRSRACQPRIVCRTAQIATVQALIALGRGVSLLPEMAQRADAGKVRAYRPLAGGHPRRTVAVAWHRNRYHSPAAEQFLATLRRYCGSPATN